MLARVNSHRLHPISSIENDAFSVFLLLASQLILVVVLVIHFGLSQQITTYLRVDWRSTKP